MNLAPVTLVVNAISIIGSAIATNASIQAMLLFAAKHGIKPQIEKFPLNKTGIVEAMQKLREGKMRYRGVLVAP
jgi:D-arabinose 1-dehydrogenase-like Zn-dependent alcohol dehydrogenase